MTSLQVSSPRPRADWRAVAVILATIIAAFAVTDHRRDAAMRRAQEQRQALSVQVAKVCVVLRCEGRHGP